MYFSQKSDSDLEYLSRHIESEIYLLSGVISILYVLFMCYRIRWLANLVWVGEIDAERKSQQKNKSMGIVKKREGLQRK